MGGDDSQKLRPWRGMHSSPGRNKLRARWRNQHFSSQDLPNWTYGFDWSSLDWRAIDQFLAAHWEHLKAATSSRGILEKPRTF